MAGDEKKIFIDEDWKSQVEREKEQARAVSQPAAEEKAAEDLGDDEMSLFETLISGLSAQTLLALGLLAHEGQQQVVVDLGMAQHLIETLAMLRDKTKGNLDPREEAGLTEALSELQRAFSVRAQQAQEMSLKEAGIDPRKGPPA